MLNGQTKSFLRFMFFTSLLVNQADCNCLLIRSSSTPAICSVPQIFLTTKMLNKRSKAFSLLNTYFDALLSHSSCIITKQSIWNLAPSFNHVEHKNELNRMLWRKRIAWSYINWTFHTVSIPLNLFFPLNPWVTLFFFFLLLLLLLSIYLPK